MEGGKKFLVLFLIILFPSLLYVVLSKGKHNFMTLASYGPKEISENGDTLYHTIPAFNFTNQFGQQINSRESDQKYIVANFFFTTCKTICIPMNLEMQKVYHAFKDREDIVFYSFTVDPETDSSEALLEYSKQFRDIEKGKWQFLTGKKEDLYALAQKKFFLTAMQDSTIPDFIHDDRIVLLDKKRRIRGFYKATDGEEIKRLIDEIKVLKVEEQIPKKEAH